MFGRLIDGRGHWVVAAGLCGAVALLVFLAFGRDHVRTVTQTKTETVTRVSPSEASYAGVQSLADFLKAQTSKKVNCPKGVPAHTACYEFGGPNFYVFLAAPA